MLVVEPSAIAYNKRSRIESSVHSFTSLLPFCSPQTIKGKQGHLTYCNKKSVNSFSSTCSGWLFFLGYLVRLGSIEAIHLFIVAVQRENSFNQASKPSKANRQSICRSNYGQKHHAHGLGRTEPPRPQATKRQILRLKKQWLPLLKSSIRNKPQAGGPAQEAAAEPVETGAKPGRANQGTQDCGAATCDPFG
ncbi:hypothetical protein KY289_024831 [Solanum tuberosum]|nr:hypothetical protein KY289_024831 [Solanum tuberosum]